MVGAFILGALLQILVVIIPQFAQIFKVQNLTSQQWIYTIIISVLPIVIVEIQKLFNARNFGKWETTSTRKLNKPETEVYGFKREYMK